ncbi:MAG: antibiotic biosynthesis monooxygenase [Alphaproteobacteria bacterium]|nr:antibiotic biosynthesis monooxygenase [Alphaproteobacteria bacterium]
MHAIIATIRVKAGNEKDFEAVALELVKQVNEKEPGCRLYTLARGETPLVYTFIERYVDQAAMDQHRAADHFRELGRKMGQFMDGKPEILRLTEL